MRAILLISRFISVASEAIIGPVGNLVATVLATILAIFFFEYKQSHRQEEFWDLLSSIFIGFILYVFIETMIRAVTIVRLEKKLEHATSILEDAVDQRYIYSRISDILIRLAAKRGIVQELGIKRLNSYMIDIHVSRDKNRLRFRSQSSILDSFADLWDIVVNLQEERGKAEPIILFVTHADGIGLYSDRSEEYTLKLYAQQARFIECGGIIFRILIQKSSKVEDRKIKEYMYVISKMIGIGVNVGYFNSGMVDDAGLTHLNHDIFLLHPMFYSSEWKRSDGQVLKEGIISNEPDDYDRQMRTWVELAERLKAYSYEEDPAIGETIDVLKQSRASFFAELDKHRDCLPPHARFTS